MSFDPSNETVAQLLERHKRIRAEFEERQAAFQEAKEAFYNARAVVVDFERKFGRIISLFED